MRLISFIAASTLFFAFLAGSYATPSPASSLALVTRDATVTANLGTSLNAQNFYGAPIPPWKKGAKPGWYYGSQTWLLEELGFVLPCLKDQFICWLLDLLPFGCLRCPPPKPPTPPSPWKQTFSNLTAAVSASDYLTFGLVDTVDDCQTMCLGVTNCNFYNTYHDVNGKNGSPLLTCALFSLCHTAADATNTGGQTQPDGSVDYITNSDGFCFTANSTSTN